MHDPKSLEAFFTQYLPSFKFIIEDYWSDNRAELVDFLSDCISSKVMPEWMDSYFLSMLQQTKKASHEYTSPWEVL